MTDLATFATQRVFGDFPLPRFVAEYLYRFPLALQGTAGCVRDLGSWATLEALLRAPDLDLMVVRDGTQYAGDDPRDLAAAQALSREGWTILVRHAERRHQAIGDVATAFNLSFRAPVNVHIYVTPPGRHGFSWHYDAEDVFILQTAGEKEYLLRKNTVNPWPLEETLPADMRFEREQMPFMRVLLKAGDLLYVPCGYWHRADASGSAEAAISLAVGVMSRSAIEVFDRLRSRLLESLAWRQRLPVLADPSDAAAEALVEQYRALLASLSVDLARQLNDPALVASLLEQAGLSPRPRGASR
jgi:ribosomal protein L16 Arg81 hydroxylase